MNGSCPVCQNISETSTSVSLLFALRTNSEDSDMAEPHDEKRHLICIRFDQGVGVNVCEF